MMDASSDMVQTCKNAEEASPNNNIETTFVVGDEEFLPIKERCMWHLCVLVIINWMQVQFGF